MQLKVLVAEGDPHVRSVITRCLRKAGNDVHEVADGQAMLHALAGGHFDLIITDMLLPGSDARQTVALLRQRLPAVRIVALDDGGSNVWQPGCFQPGSVHLLPKPFTPRQLLGVVSAIFGSLAGV